MNNSKSKQPAQKRKHRRRRHHFIAAWIRSPRGTGAMLPSSRTLARAMARQVDLSKPGIIVELGPGTGVVTHALLEAGIPPERLLVIERDAKLHAVMTAQFPDLKILCADALYLDEVLASNGVKEINAIVSSLPLLTMPGLVRQSIERGIAGVIGQGGIIVQFTYGLASPFTKSKLGQYRLEGTRVKTVLTNVPPAHVWVYRRAAQGI